MLCVCLLRSAQRHLRRLPRPERVWQRITRAFFVCFLPSAKSESGMLRRGAQIHKPGNRQRIRARPVVIQVLRIECSSSIVAYLHPPRAQLLDLLRNGERRFDKGLLRHDTTQKRVTRQFEGTLACIALAGIVAAKVRKAPTLFKPSPSR